MTNLRKIVDFQRKKSQNSEKYLKNKTKTKQRSEVDGKLPGQEPPEIYLRSLFVFVFSQVLGLFCLELWFSFFPLALLLLTSPSHQVEGDSDRGA